MFRILFISLVLLFTQQSFAQNDQLMNKLVALSQKMAAANDPCLYLPEYKSLVEQVSKANPELREMLTPMKNIFDSLNCGAANKSSSQNNSNNQISNNVSQEAAYTRTPDEEKALSRSISRVGIAIEMIPNLIALVKQISDVFIEYRKEKMIAYSNKYDDAVADKRGFKRRESDNFIIYYHEGDIDRAQTTLKFAEESKPKMFEIFHHFPDAKSHDGQKIPIYLLQKHENYLDLSKCPASSIACVTHIALIDGMKSTVFISPNSLMYGVDDFKKTIIHELTHYTQFDLINTENLVNLRPWFLEGLAAFVAGEDERIVALRKRYFSNRLIPLKTLNDVIDRNSIDSLALYEEGYSVFQMLSSYGMSQLSKYVLSTSQKTSIEAATQEVYSLSFNDFENQWDNYLKKLFGPR